MIDQSQVELSTQKVLDWLGTVEAKHPFEVLVQIERCHVRLIDSSNHIGASILLGIKVVIYNKFIINLTFRLEKKTFKNVCCKLVRKINCSLDLFELEFRVIKNFK